MTPRTHQHIAALSIMILCAILGAACQPAVSDQQVTIPAGGDAERGRQLIGTYGCGSCHTIPGVTGANALVGPPLTDWAGRHYIAGNLINTPQNLSYWIRFPQQVEPGTAMPDLGVSEQDALDITTYLYTLGRDRLQNRQALTQEQSTTSEQ